MGNTDFHRSVQQSLAGCWNHNDESVLSYSSPVSTVLPPSWNDISTHPSASGPSQIESSPTDAPVGSEVEYSAYTSSFVHTITTSSTSTQHSSKSSDQASKPTPSSSNGPYFGDITWFTPGLGACGDTSTDSDHIVSLAEDMWGSSDAGNPNENPVCNKSITISYKERTAHAVIKDKCGGCVGADLDLTKSLFRVFAPLKVGRVKGVRWTFD